MHNTSVSLYCDYELSLIDRFYKSCGIRLRCTAAESVFGLRLLDEHNKPSAIVAAVRFIPLTAESWLMRNVCVAEPQRRKGLALHLLHISLPQLPAGACYCYAYDYLDALYCRAGFDLCPVSEADPVVAEDYARYLHHRKNLILMRYQAAFSESDF